MLIERTREDVVCIDSNGKLHNLSEYKGAGIGLAHCKKIVELHGGKIGVESKSETGSTFMFSIPKT